MSLHNDYGVTVNENLKANATPVVKQRVSANFRYEPVGGLKKRNALQSLWENPLLRIAILTPFVVALLMILEQYGLLPYQW